MTRFECPHEQETLDALTARRLPGRAAPELLSHLEGCDVCRDLVAVVTAMQEVCDEDASSPAPSAATVWWRAQLRAQREASRKAAVPIRVAQVAAVIVALVTVAALQPLLPSWKPTLAFDIGALTAWWPRLPSVSMKWPSIDDLPPLTLESLGQITGWWWLALAIGAWIVVAPLALYFARSDD
jgi:predicted anti-sigma-YlaC factor YlaD